MTEDGEIYVALKNRFSDTYASPEVI